MPDRHRGTADIVLPAGLSAIRLEVADDQGNASSDDVAIQVGP
jgi:hypothetical protein